MGIVRPAAEKDIPAILRLLVQVNMVHHRGRPDLFRGLATKYSGEELRSILRHPETPVFVFEEDGRVLGHAFCVLQQKKDDSVLTDIRTLYIDDICVDEATRRTGAGKALFDRTLAFAREKGCYNVTLNVWSCNPGALAFYEKMGMTPQKIGMETIL